MFIVEAQLLVVEDEGNVKLDSTIPANQGTKVEATWVELPEGQRRFMHQWSPTIEPKGHVTIIHGLGEHGGRYIRLAPHLARQGFQVSALDLPGHGRSPGKRGAIRSYESLLDDVQFAVQWAKQTSSGLPVCLFGHSMGGNLVANYALRRSDLPDAVIASSPMFVSPKEPKGLLNIAARLAAKVVPNYTLAASTETKQLMDDPVEQELLDNDPLFHRRMTLRLGASLIDSGRWAIENADRLAVPMLLTHGLSDRITLPEGSRSFAARAGELCRLQLLEEHLHESFRDKRRQQVIQLYIDFLNELVAAK